MDLFVALFSLLFTLFPCFFFIFWIFAFFCILGMFFGMWKIFEKAGHPGWAAIVPFYNFWILTIEIAEEEELWFILSLIPCANIVAFYIIDLGVAKKFGKSTEFGIGMFLLPFVFYPLLGFGDAQYQGSPPTANSEFLA